MNPRVLLLAVVAGVAVVAAVAGFVLLRDGDEGDDLRQSAMSPGDLYADVAQRLGSMDVLHLEMEAEGSGAFSYTAHFDVWLDGREHVVREEIEVEGQAQTRSITNSAERFEVSPGRPPTPPGGDNGSSVASSRFWICNDSGPAASYLLGCASVGDEVSQSVLEGSRDGRDVVVLRTESTGRGSDRTISTVSHLYLDASTLLPVYAEAESDWEGFDEPVRLVTRYTTVEEVPASALAPVFFEPAAIGWLARDPVEGMRGVTDLQRYWLGPEFTTPTGDTFVLYASVEAPGRGSPYRYSLQYALKAAPHEPPFLNVQVFHRDMWLSMGEISPAVQQQVMTLGDVVVFVIGGGVPALDPATLQVVLDAVQPYEPAP